MESTAFDAVLKLEDAKGKVLAQHDDVHKGNLNARILFTPSRDMDVRVVATSFLQRGVGPYTLRIREFIGKP